MSPVHMDPINAWIKSAISCDKSFYYISVSNLLGFNSEVTKATQNFKPTTMFSTPREKHAK